MMAATYTGSPQRYERVSTRKFMLWLGIVSIVMLFAGLTSAYIVRQGEGKWVNFELPSLFMVSTTLIVLSSVTLQWALISVKKNNLGRMNLALVLTAVFGLGFVLFQYLSWKQLGGGGIYFVGAVKDINMNYQYIKAGTEKPFVVTKLEGLVSYSLTGFYIWHWCGGLISFTFF